MTPEQASQKYHWCKYDKDTNTIELFLDHHTLSGFRMCEALGVFQSLINLAPNYGMDRKTKIVRDLSTGKDTRVPDDLYEQTETELKVIPQFVPKRKPWFLEFGEYLHYMLEVYYKSFIHRESFAPFNYDLQAEQQCLNLAEFLSIGKKVWLLMDMDYYDGVEDEYTKINGWPGVASLLTQYYTYYMNLRVRVVDTEIVFGYNKEVHLGTFAYQQDHQTGDYIYTVKCYLTGRIDLLVDNGNKIGCVDHKGHASFSGYESDKFNPQDAITGYILASREILKRNYPKYFDMGKECLGGWIYHISRTNPSKSRTTGLVGPRFKVTPVDKTLEQLEDFKARQLSTYERICELMFNNKVPEWNTLACDNIYMRSCPYKLIHRSPSVEWPQIIAQNYVYIKPWNPSQRDSDEIDSKLKGE